MPTDKLREAAEKIDAYFDSQLYDGMPDEEAIRVSLQRDQAHRELTQAILKKAMQF